MGRREVHRRFWWENLREENQLEDLRAEGWIILKGIFKKWIGVWTGSIWLRIEASGGLL